MDVDELSVTADLVRRSSSGLEQLPAAAAGEPADGLASEPWVQERLLRGHPGAKLVFSAHGQHVATQHLSTGLSNDHLFLSLLQNDMIRDMLVLYTANRKIISALKFGLPVCGHPTIVHGGMISAIFDEHFGILLFAERHQGHTEFGIVYTARLEVDYKKPLPAESTIVCEAEVESTEGRKIWLTATLRDPTCSTVYACSRALFVKPREQEQQQGQQEQPSQAAAAGSKAAAS